MNTDAAFPTDLPSYSVHLLSPQDRKLIQGLYDRCLDYMLLVDGHPAASDAGEKAFTDVPPGKSPTDKFMFGIINSKNELVGILDVLHGYPEASVWWIGLFLLTPEVRSKGAGQMIIQGFIDFARKSGVHYIMLGVVEENKRAFQFWSKVGCSLVRETEPQKFGDKTQVVKIMSLKIQAE